MTFKGLAKGALKVFVWLLGIGVLLMIGEMWQPSLNTKIAFLAIVASIVAGKLFDRLDQIRAQLSDIESLLRKKGFD